MGKLKEFFRNLFNSWLNRDEEETQPTETSVPETTAQTTAATEETDTQQVKTGPDGEEVIPVDTMPNEESTEPAQAETTAPAEETVEETEAEATSSSVETEAAAEETEAEEAGNPMTPVVVNSEGEEVESTENTEVTIAPETEATEAAPVLNTVTEAAPPEETTFIGGFLDGGWVYAVLGLVIALLIGLANRMYHNYQREQRRKRKASRRKLAEQTQQQTVAESQMTAVDNMPAEGAVAAAAASGMRSAVFQDVGAREDQQDSYGMTDPSLYHSQGVLALVADGMGGLANGKAVSSELVNTFLGGFGSVSSYENPQEILLDLAIRANYSINEHFRGADRSGSTLVSVMVRDGYLHFLTVGDSRIYLYRAGSLIQLNREHIYQEELAVKAVNRQVPIGQVTADRQAHALTSFFGIGTIPYMDRNDAGIKLMSGDRILLCSDGVFGTLTQEQMEYALQHDVKDAAAMMRDLIREADRPYQDNNTGLILEFLG